MNLSSPIEESENILLRQEEINHELACRLSKHKSVAELCQLADKVRQFYHGNYFQLCSIINARSGNCSEDCRFCAQSSFYNTDIKKYPMVEEQTALTIARETDDYNIHRLSLVTSGKKADDQTIDKLTILYKKIAQQTNLKLCASMGLIDGEQFKKLADSGVSRYHCNLETSKSFFPSICTTHTWEEKIATLGLAKEWGMSICSGTIIGLGESMKERIELAFELKEIKADSIPINLLSPIPGTPMGKRPLISLPEALRSVALFRLINPKAIILMAGGQQLFKRDKYSFFSSGANGSLVGNYLTTVGSKVENDLARIKKMGFSLKKKKNGNY